MLCCDSLSEADQARPDARLRLALSGRYAKVNNAIPVGGIIERDGHYRSSPSMAFDTNCTNECFDGLAHLYPVFRRRYVKCPKSTTYNICRPRRGSKERVCCCTTFTPQWRPQSHTHRNGPEYSGRVRTCSVSVIDVLPLLHTRGRVNFH